MFKIMSYFGLVLFSISTLHAARVAEMVQIGGKDFSIFVQVFGQPGDANNSLIAIKDVDGKVSGQMQDHWGAAPYGLHGVVDCLKILDDGKTAFISGLITNEPSFGLEKRPFLIKVVDNGDSSNAQDQASFYITGHPGQGNSTICERPQQELDQEIDAHGGLFVITEGQVSVKKF